MNLVSQIIAANEPMTSVVQAPHARLKNLLLGGPAQSAKALERYRGVMSGRGWMTRSKIENALGYAPTVSVAYLMKLLAAGTVERRNKGGSKTFSRVEGYEWRWKA